MRVRTSLLLAVALLACLTVAPCTALISSLTLTHDTRTAIHLKSFGYEAGGRFRLELSELQLRVPEGTPVRDGYELAMVLIRSESDAPMRLDDAARTSGPTGEDSVPLPLQPNPRPDGPPPAPGFVPLLKNCLHRQLLRGEVPEGGDSSSSLDNKLLALRLERRDMWRQFVHESVIDAPGFYHLYFSNCEPGSSVSLRIELTEYNVESDGVSRMYLSAGERYLPTLLAVLAAAFLLEALVWGNYLRKHRIHVRRIHMLMLACVIVKGMALSIESLKYHVLKTSGVRSLWFDLYYVISVVKGLLLFCVIVLLATGWSFLKPFLQDRDRTVLLVILTIQVLVNIASIFVGELPEGSVGWSRWSDALSILDLVCWCATLIPIMWSIQSLRLQAREDAVRGERAVRNLIRLRNFRAFYMLVICFVYVTRLLVFLLAFMLPFEQTWIATLFAEVAALIFYAGTGVLFRPQGANPYLPLQVGDEELDAELGVGVGGRGAGVKQGPYDEGELDPEDLSDLEQLDARAMAREDEEAMDAQLDEAEGRIPSSGNSRSPRTNWREGGQGEVEMV